MIKLKKILGTLLILQLCSLGSHAQNYQISEESSCDISGTSSLANWTAKVGEMTGGIELGGAFAGANLPEVGSKVVDAEIVIPVSSIEGARGEAMTGKIHRAFKSEEHPNITFVLSEAGVSEIKDVEAGTFIIETKGQLSMAGVSKEIELPFEVKKQADGSFQFDAVYKLNMTDYGIEPPSAMFGQIECGESVTIIFNLLTSVVGDD